MKALWIAADGTKFMIEGDTIEECQAIVRKLREELGKATPDIEHVHAMNAEVKAEAEALPGVIKEEDIEDDRLRQYIRAMMQAQLNPPDPKNQN